MESPIIRSQTCYTGAPAPGTSLATAPKGDARASSQGAWPTDDAQPSTGPKRPKPGAWVLTAPSVPRCISPGAPSVVHWVNHKERLLPSQLPRVYQDERKHRFSALYNAHGFPLLVTRSIDSGANGKLRIAVDAWLRAYALKGFRTEALPPKARPITDSRPVRESWPLHRIYEEAHTMKAASSDLVVYDVIEADGKGYIVHTLGQSGLAALVRYVPESLKVACAYFVMHAMAHKLMLMHERGYVHGDVKVTNALFRRRQVMLCDFGATEPMGADGRVRAGLCSTYPAPEQARGHRFGTAADVWSLGASWGDLFGINDNNLFTHEQKSKATADHLDDYKTWRASLFDGRGRLIVDRLVRDTSPWGHYFQSRMRFDTPGTIFVLSRMLEPNAMRRASLANVIAFFAANTQSRQDEDACVIEVLSKIARGSSIQRTLNDLRAVVAYNRAKEQTNNSIGF